MEGGRWLESRRLQFHSRREPARAGRGAKSLTSADGRRQGPNPRQAEELLIWINGWLGMSKRMSRVADAAFTAIEETQARLRESIERAKELAGETDRLIRRHRRERRKPAPNRST